MGFSFHGRYRSSQPLGNFGWRRISLHQVPKPFLFFGSPSVAVVFRSHIHSFSRRLNPISRIIFRFQADEIISFPNGPELNSGLCARARINRAFFFRYPGIEVLKLFFQRLWLSQLRDIDGQGSRNDLKAAMAKNRHSLKLFRGGIILRCLRVRGQHRIKAGRQRLGKDLKIPLENQAPCSAIVTAFASRRGAGRFSIS
jgi:hypothetical protein